MKKRALLVFLTGVLLLSSCLLTACDDVHTHTYYDQWRKNPTHHWHACQEAGCDSTDARGEHTWDGGTVVVPATRESAGEMDYSCTVCGYTKREALAYNAVNTVDATAWLAAFSNFDNCEIRITRNIYYVRDGVRADAYRTNERIEEFYVCEGGYRRVSAKKELLYVREARYISKYEINYEDEKPVWVWATADAIPDLSDGGSSVPLLQTKDLFSSFVYDEATRSYVAYNVTYYSPAENKYVTVDRVNLGFENGVIDYYSYSAKGVDSKGTPYDQEVVLKVGNYGGVVITAPVAT